MSQTIQIRGARTHNLQSLDLELPRDRLIVFTGLSGSGKSSLAFDTIYAEGQRRYVESLSAYARQFLSMMEKPDVDTIEGLSPAISIEQKSTSHNPRSTVGTVTEIYDYLRLLYARAGIPRCPDHGLDLTAQTVSQMVDQVLALPEGTALALHRADHFGPQGRAPAGDRGTARQGFRAGARGRQVHRARCRAEARPQEEAFDRCRRRPPESPRRSPAATRGVVRNRAQARRRLGPRRIPRRSEARGTRVLRQVRLPDLRLLRVGARTAPLLLQQPLRRLPGLRRPRRQAVLRPGSRRREPAALACQWRGARLGPEERLLLPDDPGACGSLPVRSRGAICRSAGKGPRSTDAGQWRRRNRVPLFRLARPNGPAQAQVRGHPAEPRAAL